MACEIETPTLQTDPCNGCRYDTRCVYRELPSSILDLPENSSLEEYIVNLITTIQSLNNQAQTTTNNLEALEQTISEIEVPEVNYKIYRALLTQNSSNDPTSLVLENTIGESIVWKRSSTGVYTAEVSSGFDVTKTFCKTNGFASVNVQLFSFINTFNNKIVLNIRDIITNLPVDSTLSNTPIEIIVYN